MAKSDGGVRVGEQHRHRLADDIRAAYHDRVFAGELDTGFGDETHAPERGRGDKARSALRKPTDIVWVKTVDIFSRVDPIENGLGVNVLGKRQLHQDPVHAEI